MFIGAECRVCRGQGAAKRICVHTVCGRTGIMQRLISECSELIKVVFLSTQQQVVGQGAWQSVIFPVTSDGELN